MNRLPAGDYYIGDPCYVINDKWSEFLEVFWAARDLGSATFIFEDVTCAAFNTQHGDGTYTLEPRGDTLLVDAGIIAAIPGELVSGGGHGGTFVTFDSPVQCQAVNGVLHFGDFNVNTGWEEEEEHDVCSYCGN